MATDSFSLKDHLFNRAKVEHLAGELAVAYPDFATAAFTQKALKRFPELELMERIGWLRECLREFLPEGYEAAVGIILKSLPPPCDPTLSDDDFGDFIYAPYGDFVATYGCTAEQLDFSLAALKELTTRFSVEGSIRYFLNAFPKETMRTLATWVDDEHYHVRRLVSEGTRPKLPWAKAISLPYQEPLPLLDQLHADPTRFVTRSVANHLNDISKLDGALVVKTLKRWQKEQRQTKAELDFITKHALRTLVKAGDQGALALLGYDAQAIEVKQFAVATPRVKIGDALAFSFNVISTSDQSQKLMIDYIVHFNKANGTTAPKTYKIAQKTLAPKETLTVTKKHPLRVMTTRRLHPGTHQVELQINGQKFDQLSFELIA